MKRWSTVYRYLYMHIVDILCEKNQFRSWRGRNKNKIEKSPNRSIVASLSVGLGSHYYCSRLVCGVSLPPLDRYDFSQTARPEWSSFRPENYSRPHRSLFLYIYFFCFPKTNGVKRTADRATKRILHEGHISQRRDSYKRNPRERWGTLCRCAGRRDLVSLVYGVRRLRTLFTSDGCRCGGVSVRSKQTAGCRRERNKSGETKRNGRKSHP